ncbi:MAG TPA: sorbitol dehydrogenase [Lentisphaeria bacterium]|nr:MAG: sorbitol dehydrogenase [Lentisphaerae bacterium GWF2_50_93]HCE43236.1 sorbitol dehydrogenase [Lentisphaeria bacterium]
MKAFYITSAGNAETRNIPRPAINDDEVLLRVQLVGYCGSDLNTFRGRNPMASLPRIPGHEVAATIEDGGDNVPGQFKQGMNVTLSPYTSCGTCPSCRNGRTNACQFNQTMGVQRDGALTEYISVPWQKLHASKKLSLSELAIVEPLTVGFHAASRGNVCGNDTVAVLGCGAIGLGAISGSAWRGAKVIAVDIDDAKLEIAKKSGASFTINTSRQNLHEELQKLSNGGPDVIIEAIGLPSTFKAAVEEVAFSGRVVYIGYAKEPVSYETKLFVQKELDVRGSRNAQQEDFADVIRMLEGGGFPSDRIITHSLPFAKAGDALADWDRNPALVTKILIDLYK